MMENRRLVLIGVSSVLIAITWIVYAQTLRHDFVNFDDGTYVYANRHVAGGLSFSGLVWPFAHFDADNWLPLTTISHMADCQFFGLKAGGHHFTNLLLHTVGVVLLFLALNRMTAALWPSAFVAAVFAVHPLHVESIAWISERKDVLSGVFFMLTLLAYFAWTRKRNLGRYLVMSFVFACGLMSKPMLVTTPIVLLLLDYWPLRRTGQSAIKNLLMEKIPLFFISIVFSAVTLVVLRDAMPSLETLPVSWRISNAATASVIYLWQMIWPANLTLAYPLPGQPSVLQTATVIALLIAISVIVLAMRRRRPYLFTGWCWYLVMLVPVLGLIQVGGQAHADRYTYLPQIGLYIAVIWAIVDLTAELWHRRLILGAAAACVILVLSWVATVQASTWLNSETLWRHAIAVTHTQNDLAHLYLGEWLLDQDRPDEALPEFETVLADYPEHADAHFNIGNVFLKKNEPQRAVAEYEIALRIDPAHSDAETGLANVLFDLGQRDESIGHYRNVVWLHPTSAAAHYNLGRALYREHRISEAITHYEEAVAIDPDYPNASSSLTQALLDSKQTDQDRFRPKKP